MAIRINTILHKPDLYDVGTWRFFDQEQSSIYNVKGIYWIAAKEAKDYYSRNHKTNYGILYLMPKEKNNGRPLQCPCDHETRRRPEEDRGPNSNILTFRGKD